MEHVSVLLNESIKILNLKHDGIYVDCTLGRGGHTKEILKNLGPNGRVLGFDQDESAILQVKETVNDKRLLLIHDNFCNLKANLILHGIKKIDGVFYDLGVSSPQFDEQDRGFSYRFDSELDMRMDQVNNSLTAKKVVNEFDEKTLAKIFFEYGDEQFAFKIAKNICQFRVERSINTTFELVEIIKKSLPQKVLKQKKHPAKKTFQALRIFVNDEINVIKNSLSQATDVLKKNGVLAVITFHSLEEKVIKSFMKEKSTIKLDSVMKSLPIMEMKQVPFQMLTKKPILPSAKELEQNRRSHSAKLWALKKMED